MSKSTKQPAIEHWWTRFGSRELNDLISAADLENLDIAVAVAQLHQAEAQAEIAGAALWPTLDYIDNNTRTQSSGTNQPGVITSPTRRNSFSKTLSASYVLDIWGRNRDALEAALHTASASAYQIEVVRLTALIGVVDNFLIYAASQERVLVAQENFVNARRVLKIIEERKAAGTASDLDVAQQRTLVETTSATIPLLRQAAETARTQLALLTGRPVQAISLEAKRIQSLKLPTVSPGIPAALLVRRPDIRNAEQQLAAADADVDVARKAFLPTIQLTAQGGFQSALLSTLLRPQSAIYSLAAGTAARTAEALPRPAPTAPRDLPADHPVGAGRRRECPDRAERGSAPRGRPETCGRIGPPRFPTVGRAAATGNDRLDHTLRHSKHPVSGAGYPDTDTAGAPAGRSQPVPGARRRLGRGPRRICRGYPVGPIVAG